jgi:hypothetical protein
MAHDVHFSVPGRSLGRSDVQFQVYQDHEMLGTLKVSKGSVVWFPANTTYGYRMYWGPFNKVMQEQANSFEKR